MKPLRLIAAFLLFPFLLPAQAPTQYPLAAAAPPPVSIGRTSIVGTPGFYTYYYWVVANYPPGSVFPSRAFRVQNANQALSVSNYVTLNWNSTGALTYDVLRTTTDVFPPGTSCTCAVATGLTSTTLNDQGSALASYTMPSAASAAAATIFLDNLDYQAAQLRAAISGSEFQLASPIGTTLPLYCKIGDHFFKSDATAGQNDYVCTAPNTWTAVVDGITNTYVFLPNGFGGTVQNTLTRIQTGQAVIQGVYSPAVFMSQTLGVCVSGCGATGIAKIQTSGIVNLAIDNASVTQHLLGISTTTSGSATDIGVANPGPGLGTSVVGRVLSSNASPGTYTILLQLVQAPLIDRGFGTLASIPAACTVSQMFFVTDAAPGANLYICTATNTWTAISGSGGGLSAAYSIVAFSATPSFAVTASTAIQTFQITLTGNVTSSTLTTAGATAGQVISFRICQDPTGSRAFVPPANVLGMGTISPTASTCSNQDFRFDGTNANAIGNMYVTGTTGGAITLPGSSSGSTVLQPAATASGTVTLPAATDTLVGKATTDTLTNKSIDASEVNSGTLAAARMPALTGDCTTSAGTVNLTCNKTGGLFNAYVVASSGTASGTTTSASEANLLNAAIPANTMGANGTLMVKALYKFVGTVGAKTPIIRLTTSSGATSGGIQILGSGTASNALSSTILTFVSNANATNSQVGNLGFGNQSTTTTTGAVDTTAQTFINFNCLTASGDSCQVLAYSVTAMPAN